MKLNLPNWITIFRILLIPFLVLTIFGGIFEESLANYIALGIFIIASATDFLDGFIARKYNLITNLGKFMDPLADKLLVSAAMISFVQLGKLQAWIVIIIIAREFIITGFRTIAASCNIVLAASYLAKLKTVFQMTMIVLIFLIPGHVVTDAIVYITVFLTFVSGFEYIYKNISVLKG